MRWSANDFLALPGDVIAFAWSAPMRELAANIGISDVALKKMLNAAGIVTPPQGHWNRVHAGRAVTAPPPPRPRRAGESGRVRLDGRFRGHVPESGPMPEGGPFASTQVPEELAELRAQELARIGKARAPRDLSRAHVGLAKLLENEAARAGKAAASHWHSDEPHFAGPLAQRQLRLASGLLTALSGRGHSGEVWDDNEALKVTCIIGDTRLGLDFAIMGQHRTEMRRRWQHPARDLPARNPLRMALTVALRAPLTTEWQDTADCPLEKQLAVIAADLIVAAEAALRQGLVEARERAEAHKRWLAERERERQAERNRERLARLEESGALLRQAEDLRTLVERVSAAVDDRALGVGEGELAAWRAWALERADQLDPVVSGQLLQHIRPSRA